jgi:hypothetical protein
MLVCLCITCLFDNICPYLHSHGSRAIRYRAVEFFCLVAGIIMRSGTSELACGLLNVLPDRAVIRLEHITDEQLGHQVRELLFQLPGSRS